MEPQVIQLKPEEFAQLMLGVNAWFCFLSFIFGNFFIIVFGWFAECVWELLPIPRFVQKVAAQHLRKARKNVRALNS